MLLAGELELELGLGLGLGLELGLGLGLGRAIFRDEPLDVPPERSQPHTSPVSDDLVINASHAIPRHELVIRATRSGGPGGQHVNTSSTRVEVRWNLEASVAFTVEEKARLAQRLSSRLDGDAWIRVAASDTRSQRQNRLLAEERLAGLVARALVVRRKRVKTAPTAGSREDRLRVKKLRSRRKRDRGRPEED